MNLDKSFISLIIQENNPEFFKKAIKLVPPSLLSDKEKQIYEFILNYYRETKGSLPSKTVILNEFKEYKLYKNITDKIEYFANKLKERKEYNLLTTAISTIGNSLISKDLEKAKEIYREYAYKLGETDIETVTTVKSTLIERQKEYLDAKKNKGKIGYYVGIPTLDKHLGGINKEFIILMGRQGVGKTFLSLMMVCSIWKEVNSPVLIVSNEMPVNEIYKRIDAIVTGINFSRYRKGLLTKEEEVKLKNLKKMYNNLPDLYVINGAGKSAYDIEYDIVAINPSIILIDGIYLTDMGKNDFVSDTIAASRAYQRINKKYSIPIIATSQMANDKGTKYARALQEDADIVLSMFQNQHLKDANLMRLFFYKLRNDNSDVEAFIKWDFDNWDFGESENSEVYYGDLSV